MVKCERATDSSPQSVVVCVHCQPETQRAVLAGLQRKGQSLYLDDSMASAATVTIGDCIYFIVTPAQGERVDNLKRKWVIAMKKVTCANLRKLHELANIDWVKPLDRSLQRILDLGVRLTRVSAGLVQRRRRGPRNVGAPSAIPPRLSLGGYPMHKSRAGHQAAVQSACGVCTRDRFPGRVV